MNDSKKTKAQLIEEIEALRARVRRSERAETRHGRVERSLRQSEARYRGLFENAHDMIYTHDFDGNFTSANPSILRSFGYSLEEFLRLNIRHVVDKAFLPAAIDNLHKKMEGIVYTEPYQIVTRARDGSPVWVEVASCLITEEGRPVGVQGILRDITERKRAEEALRKARDELEVKVQERTAELRSTNVHLEREIAEHQRTEEALRESEQRYRLLAEYATDVIWTTDFDLGFTYISPSTTRIRGYSVKEAMAQRIEDMMTPASYDLAMKAFREIPPAEALTAKDLERTWTLELELTCKNGSTVWTEVKTSLLRDADGCPIGFLGVSRDIKERKRAEIEKARLQEQLHQVQKMEAVGQLAAGIAHDFSNLLALIIGHAEQGARGLPADSPAYNALTLIEQVARQATQAAKGLLTFSRNIPSEKRLINLPSVVEESARLFHRTLPASIALTVESPDDAPLWVSADSGQIQQVILNLMINARDAMPCGGGLRVAVRQEPRDFRGAAAAAPEAPAILACLEVRDEGVGMVPEVKSRIFEPFFTTKKRGQGTGLGLSIVHGIVEAHGGTIEVHSEPGHGSTFKVLLPAAAPVAVAEETGAVPPPGDRRRALILLAVGQRLLREIMVSALRSEGHEVLQAGDGPTAIGYHHQYRGELGLSVLDVELAQCGGLECLAQFRSSGDATPAILISGGEEVESFPGLDERTAVLGKPFTVPEFSRLVHDMLAIATPRGILR
jgi:PAS domain S-box-containing protein